MVSTYSALHNAGRYMAAGEGRRFQDGTVRYGTSCTLQTLASQLHPQTRPAPSCINLCLTLASPYFALLKALLLGHCPGRRASPSSRSLVSTVSTARNQTTSPTGTLSQPTDRGVRVTQQSHLTTRYVAVEGQASPVQRKLAILPTQQKLPLQP